MPILTPTKATGSTAKSDDVVYVERDQTVTDDQLATMAAIEGMNAAFVADLLSACLTHERCGTHLYRSVAARTNNPMLKSRYEDFGAETMRHVEILENVVVATGGNPAYVSPLARAVEAADSKALEATFLTSGGLDPMTSEMAMLDAVFMAETVDHANWEALAMLADAMPDGPARAALRDAVAEVEPDEDEHLTWARDTRARMTMLQASSSVLAKASAKAEELVSQVKALFGSNGSALAGAGTTRRRAERPPAGKAPRAKRSGAKKTAAKKSTAKRPTAQKTAEKSTKKASTKQAPAKKSTAKKSTAKKSTAKKSTAKKTTATKPTKKASTRKAPAKKSTKRRSR